MKQVIITLLAVWMIMPAYISADTGTNTSNDFFGLNDDFCRVPVYHTHFAFPPEGGEIVQLKNGDMYFVRTYLPGCADAGNDGTVISTHSNIEEFPPSTSGVQTQQNNQTNSGSGYTAPKSGCD